MIGVCDDVWAQAARTVPKPRENDRKLRESERACLSG